MNINENDDENQGISRNNPQELKNQKKSIKKESSPAVMFNIQSNYNKYDLPKKTIEKSKFMQQNQNRVTEITDSDILNENLDQKQLSNIKIQNTESGSVSDNSSNILIYVKKVSQVQRLQQFVVKHFLSVSLEYLQKNGLQKKISFQDAAYMLNLKNSLDKIASSPRNNIGFQYEYINKNLFENVFLQELLTGIPSYQDQFNLKELKKTQDDFFEQKITKEEYDEQNEQSDNIDLSDSDISTLGISFKNSQKQKVKEVIDTNNLQLIQEKKKKLELFIKLRNNSEIEKKANREYFEDVKHNLMVTQPIFISFQNNILFINNERINQLQSGALQKYLIKLKNVPQKRIYKLLIEKCQMSDEVLSDLLEICIQQCVYNNKNVLQVQYLSNFSYSGNYFGPLSLEKIEILLPSIVEFNFDNITDINTNNYYYLEQLLNKIILLGKKLMKLKISNFQILPDRISEKINDVLINLRFLQHLDVSQASLQAHSLAMLSDGIYQRVHSLKSLDFSYNKLNFNNPSSSEYKYSQKFIQNMIVFFKDCIVLNHVKLSGMNFQRAELIQICQSLQQCKLLLSIHLNDNDISRNNEQMLEILTIFGLDKNDLMENNRSDDQNMITHKYEYDEKKNHINYKTLTTQLFGINKERAFREQEEKELIQKDQVINDKRKQNLVMRKNQKMVEQLKSNNNNQNQQRLGRAEDSHIDQFLLTRLINYPELIFNQRIKNDKNQNQRYFQKNASEFWKLSKKNECFMCQQHFYTIIYYQRGQIVQNQGLNAVKDPILLQQLGQEFHRNLVYCRTYTPQISGSVVKRGIGQLNFQRKLKMLRAPLFTLLCISNSKLFLKNKFQTNILKDAILKILEKDNQQQYDDLDIDHKLHGWQNILYDKCYNNELNDVYQINAPNFNQDLNTSDIYIYAALLNPGYHQILIYDPILRKAFCQNFTVGTNTKDFYPEYPEQEGIQYVKTVTNVWKHWISESEEERNQAFQNETSYDKLEILLFIKNKEDAFICLEKMQQEYQNIIIYQRELMVINENYPLIDYDSSMQQIEHVQEQNEELKYNQKFIKAQIEICFIRTNRVVQQNALNSQMNRTQLLEFILRLAQSWIYMVYSSKVKISDHILEFLNNYIKPITNKSVMLIHRQIIRQSKKLNELLFDNKKLLEEIFNTTKNPKEGFNLDAAIRFFYVLPKKDIFIGINFQQIKECFLFSQMTILNEQKYSKKYFYLTFVEFLEMICRCAILSIISQNTIEFKVFKFLETIWQYRYETGKWNQNDHLLIGINHRSTNS